MTSVDNQRKPSPDSGEGFPEAKKNIVFYPGSYYLNSAPDGFSGPISKLKTCYTEGTV
jgi:hypothetical protein